MASHVKIISDQPWGNDRGNVAFRFGAYAKVLADIALTPQNDSPLCVLVQGDWGSGKTSLFEAIRNEIMNSTPSVTKKTRTVKALAFNAWRYQESGSFLLGLMDVLLGEMKRSGITHEQWAWFERHATPGSLLRNYFPFLIKTITGRDDDPQQPSSKVSESLENRDTAEAFQQLFIEIASRWLNNAWGEQFAVEIDDRKHSLAILIDDLDRCSEAQVKNILESIKLCLGVKGLVFYLAMDGRQLDRYLVSLDPDRSKEAFDKFVQVVFRIPKPSPDAFRSYLGGLLEGHPLLEHLSDQVREILPDVLDHNPRTVKRHLNDMAMWLSVFKEVHRHLDEEELTYYEKVASHYILLSLTVQRASLTRWESVYRPASVFLKWMAGLWIRMQDHYTFSHGDEDDAILKSSARPVLDVFYELRGEGAFAAAVEAVIGFDLDIGSEMSSANPRGKIDPTLERDLPELGIKMFAYPVTQGLYEKVVGENPSYFGANDERPVESVNVYDAVEFCNQLSRLKGLEPVYERKGAHILTKKDKNGYRLPTEKEWLLACKNGYGEKPMMRSVVEAWDVRNSNGSTQPVGRKRPNKLGFYDMIGNVWEWCWLETDEDESYCRLAGNSFADELDHLLPATHVDHDSRDCSRTIGFRCVRAIR